MKIKSAKFIISNTELSKCPEPTLPEYAFIGRSNVGKSSLINLLTGRKSLAKISATPGKTQLINHFLINDTWYLVDLPGYGYAKSSKKDRKAWGKMIENYLKKRESLSCTFVLLDSRLKPQKIDLDFMEWMGIQQIPFVMVFTKMDKLSSNELNKNLAAYRKKMKERWEELPPAFTTSSVRKHGREEVLNFIEETNQVYEGE